MTLLPFTNGWPTTKRLLGALLLLALFGLANSEAAAKPAAQHTGCCLTELLHWSDDRMLNYDFVSETASSTNVDWPVTIIFHNNADVDKVKDAFDSAFGGPMYAQLDDGQGAGWEWDSDRGTKTGWVCDELSAQRHMRVYAVGDNDQMYNPNWGFWVMASTHFDVAECTDHKFFGWTEWAEEYYVNRALSDAGWWGTHDWGDTHIDEKFPEGRWEGNAFWFYDGLASNVWVPSDDGS